MIVCPVCEHQQVQGAECDVCGKRLVAGVSAADLAVPRVEGLEPTLQAPVDVPEERVTELEPTRRDPGAVAAFAPDPTPDLEATATAPVDVEVDPTPDVERISSETSDDAPTAVAAFATCRYCRTPAAPGDRICARCGMRLPVLTESAGVAETAVAPRICSCGVPVRPGAALCPVCGARLG